MTAAIESHDPEGVPATDVAESPLTTGAINAAAGDADSCGDEDGEFAASEEEDDAPQFDDEEEEDDERDAHADSEVGVVVDGDCDTRGDDVDAVVATAAASCARVTASSKSRLPSEARTAPDMKKTCFAFCSKGVEA